MPIDRLTLEVLVAQRPDALVVYHNPGTDIRLYECAACAFAFLADPIVPSRSGERALEYTTLAVQMPPYRSTCSRCGNPIHLYVPAVDAAAT